MSHPRTFAYGPSTEEHRARIEDRMRDRFTVDDGRETVVRRTFYDTFDGRIHRGGGSYETVCEGGGLVHVWRHADGRVRHRSPSDVEPGFADDLPPGPIRSEVGKRLGVRRLMPVAKVRVRIRTFTILDDLQKVVVRVRFEDGTAERPGDENVRELPARIRVLSVRGHDTEFQQVTGFLEVEHGLVPQTESELETAARAVDRVPGGYTSKLVLDLDPAMCAGDAARVIYRHLLETMRANEEGTRLDLDPEFLHDFRVAVRRTRSALGQIRGVLPAMVLERFRREFAWLGGETNWLRDLDVQLLELKAYAASLPEQARPDLDPLRQFVEKRQRTEQRRVAGVLTCDRYRTLVESWQEFLDAPALGCTDAPNADRSVLHVASERIWKIYKRVLKRGRSIEEEPEETADEALHDLRIRCKKLRYLLEFFRSLYGLKEVACMIRELKRLQDNLGDFNDCRVQRESLVEYEAEMDREGLAPPSTLRVMGRLVERLEEEQAAQRRQFAERFARFSAAENVATFRQLVTSVKPPVQPGSGVFRPPL